jgi:opacity protein-like surface antigen
MKQSCIASAVLTCVLAGSAMAADMPLKAPVPRVVSDWTGFYIGVHGGYGWADHTTIGFNKHEFAALPPDLALSSTSKLKGGVFGGHAGYNWQWSQRWVGGLEVDFSGADLKQSRSISVQDFNTSGELVDVRTHLRASKLDWLASARARLGFLLTPEFLLYGTGGAAWTHTKSLDQRDAILVLSGSSESFVERGNTSHFGWVAGAGGEWKMWNSHWLLRVEYLHYDFGNSTTSFNTLRTATGSTDINSGPFNLDSKLTTDVVRGGVSYKF